MGSGQKAEGFPAAIQDPFSVILGEDGPAAHPKRCKSQTASPPRRRGPTSMDSRFRGNDVTFDGGPLCGPKKVQLFLQLFWGQMSAAVVDYSAKRWCALLTPRLSCSTHSLGRMPWDVPQVVCK